MKSIYLLVNIFIFNFVFSQNNAQITCYQALICKNGAATLSSATSVANTPILYSLWQILGPNNFQVTDTSFVGEDLMISLPYAGLYDVNMINVHEDFTTSFDQEFQFIQVYDVHASFTDMLDGATEFWGNPYSCPPLIGYYTNTSTSVFPLQSFEWQFTNQNLAFNHQINTTENPNGIQFLYPGNIDLQLIVTDSNQCSDTVLIQNYLEILGPIAECHYSQTGNSYFLEYNFSVTNVENVASLEWNLGNGEIINDLDGFTYTYSTGGIYNAFVDAVDLFGCVVRYPLGELNPGVNSIEKHFYNTLKFYPNPSSDFITFERNFDDSISIWDINGKEISRGQYTVVENIINIRNLNAGMYFLSSNQDFTRFIKL